MDAVADKALIFNERVSGEGNRALYRALILLNSQPDDIIAPLPTGVAPEAEILRRLHEVYPVKAGYLGTAKLGALVTLSADVAAKRGVTDFSGLALLALLHFMLGANAHADPMLPWIGEALGGTPGTTARLHASAKAFLAEIVSNTPTAHV
jgi:hypothetical protein